MALLAPFLLGLAPKVRIPAVVLEIVAAIVLGPSGPGWIKADLPVQIVALLGLAFLLFLVGLEIGVHRLRGRVLGSALLGYVITVALGVAAGVAFGAAGWVHSHVLQDQAGSHRVRLRDPGVLRRQRPAA
ncbi:cation:proton antiporter [Streptomyces collinus]|uniref:cation:proton antiporter domain-containing protein n=1 Tax=Streptomyces collinus TaxID=42684 RepID=UPI002941F141|nr:cation:proton antiporter [Streptomyces collinus]